MWTTASLDPFLLGVLVLLPIPFAAVLISFWPERVFKSSDLNWWRRAALTVALYCAFVVVAAVAESIVKIFFADSQPQRSQVNVDTVLFLSIRAVIFLLPLLFTFRLRERIDFRVRGSWIALIFILPVFMEPSILGRIGAHTWSEITLILVYFMLIGFTEELVFRGYAFQLRPDRRPRETIIVTSIIFALAHFSQYSYNPFLCARVFFAGIGLGIVRLATGSIGLAIMIHGVMNIVIELNDRSTWHPGWFAFCVSAMAALYLHPSCRRFVEPKVQALCGANA